MKTSFWRKLWLFTIYFMILAMLIIAVLTLLGPTEGVIFSEIVR